MKQVLIEWSIVTGAILIIVGLVVYAEQPIKATSVSQFQSTNTDVTFPAPTDYVVDDTGVLSIQQLSNLEILLHNSDNKSKEQIGVLIINTTNPLTIEQYSIRLAEKWKVGYQGVDNGALIVLAVQDRKVRIEVGNGLQGTLTDIQAQHILDTDMVPKLKNSDWYGAIVAGINGINSN